MMRTFLWCFLWSAFAALFAESSDPSLWPLPTKSSFGDSDLTFCDGFTFITNVDSPTHQLAGAIDRFNVLIENPVSNGDLCKGVITVTSNDSVLRLGIDESYTIVTDASSITITAETIFGAMYALTTLSQLIESSAAQTLMIGNPLSIVDAPAFTHRGVMIDSSRNFLALSTIQSVIDGLAMNKLNALHWHLIDAQSFPFHSESRPTLSEKGAYSKDKIYYPADVTQIVDYGADRGVRVIPEFDSPGHTYIVTNSYPELMECNDIPSQTSDMCPEPPCGYLDVTNNDSYALFDDVFDDGFAAFHDTLFHLGADEVNPKCWGSHTNEYYTQWVQYFVAKTHDNGRTPVIWSGDISVNADLNQNAYEVVMQVWDSAAFKLKALQKGFSVIDSTYTAFYLDCGFSNWLSGGDYSWCDPHKSWLTVYNHSLTAGIPLELQSKILGGEVCLWSEQIDDNNLETRLWPRAAAAAERFWSNGETVTRATFNGINQRYAIQRERIASVGIRASPVQPYYCTLSPGNAYCDAYRDSLFAEFVKKSKSYDSN